MSSVENLLAVGYFNNRDLTVLQRNVYYKGCITIGSVSRMVKETGITRATIVRIVHDRRRLVVGKQSPASTKHYHGFQKRNITDEG